MGYYPGKLETGNLLYNLQGTQQFRLPQATQVTGAVPGFLADLYFSPEVSAELKLFLSALLL